MARANFCTQAAHDSLQYHITWWRHQMETISAFLAFCARNSPVTGEFPTGRPVTRNFDVFIDLRLNKRLSKHPWVWWFDTPPGSLWCHCNDGKCNSVVNMSHYVWSNSWFELIDWYQSALTTCQNLLIQSFMKGQTSRFFFHSNILLLI